MDTPHAPSTPVTMEQAHPVPGGWLRFTTTAEFIPATDGTPSEMPDAAAWAAGWLRSQDPQWIREQVAGRLIGLGSDPYAATLEVLAKALEGGS